MTPPPPVRWSAIISLLQSLIGIGYALLLIVRQVSGERDAAIVSESANASWVGLGTAVFFLIIFGTVLAGGIAVLRSRGRWGRGPVIMLNLILLPISFSMCGAGAWLMGIATGLSAVAVLAMMFSPRAVAWASRMYEG
ncbi:MULTISPECIES: hypothetical protein [unclassified Corynebacterium]|uniref:hypothetical protein n=1 Tax=unclassified Corynebacterium TaxID=2624378 RepID=UPI0029CA73C0|nr:MULTISPECIES: hypothetical protein [unclassified Corynebacterium]WPF66656.1 hypothetical protein OLX12_02675 [Corynebacterium sp. 22KM0430]WPF69144.1 hypothetical protein OLW90_02670 [Corynebacterium sp. 21KM1197]